MAIEVDGTTKERDACLCLRIENLCFKFETFPRLTYHSLTSRAADGQKSTLQQYDMTRYYRTSGVPFTRPPLLIQAISS